MSRKRRTVADEPYLVVRSSAADLGGSVGEHAHDWHQLVHVRSGLAVVRSDERTWLAPPTWAGVAARGACGTRSASPGRRPCGWVYLRADPPRRGVAHLAEAVGPARSAAGLRGGAGTLPARGGRDARFAAPAGAGRAGDGHRDAGPAGSARGGAGDLAGRGAHRRRARLRWRCRSPRARSPAGSPSCSRPGRPSQRAAAAVGVGRRTVERVFQAETGLPVGRWRQYRLLLRRAGGGCLRGHRAGRVGDRGLPHAERVRRGPSVPPSARPRPASSPRGTRRASGTPILGITCGGHAGDLRPLSHTEGTGRQHRSAVRRATVAAGAV
jgi:hypothetical protein